MACVHTSRSRKNYTTQQAPIDKNVWGGENLNMNEIKVPYFSTVTISLRKKWYVSYKKIKKLICVTSHFLLLIKKFIYESYIGIFFVTVPSKVD